jgi:hypothetical protein
LDLFSQNLCLATLQNKNQYQSINFENENWSSHHSEPEFWDKFHTCLESYGNEDLFVAISNFLECTDFCDRHGSEF